MVADFALPPEAAPETELSKCPLAGLVAAVG